MGASAKTGRSKQRSSHRVNVDFSENAYEILADIANRRGKTISGVLRDALALEKWYEDTKDEGGRVLVERKSGELRELLRP